jgi:hypothetical protein
MIIVPILVSNKFFTRPCAPPVCDSRRQTFPPSLRRLSLQKLLPMRPMKPRADRRKSLWIATTPWRVVAIHNDASLRIGGFTGVAAYPGAGKTGWRHELEQPVKQYEPA